MNKLLLSKDDELANLVIEDDSEIILRLNGCDKNINIIIEKNVCVSILEISMGTNNFITFSLKENSRLIYNRAIKNSNDFLVVNLEGISASLELNNSIVNTTTSTTKIDIRHTSGNTTSNLVNHGINNSLGNMDFIINAYISNDSKECITSQQNKIINTNCGKSNISPNLIVNNNDVNASHSAVISDFDNNSLFYLKSRGITEQQSRNLLIESFLIGNLKGIKSYIDEIKQLLL